MGQLRTHGFDARFCQESVIVLRGIDHQMYMGMMSLIMESRIPSQIRTVDLHVPGEHGTFGAQERHPLSGGVISKSCRILPAQADHMGPDRSLVTGYFLLHIYQDHRPSRIRKQTMLTDPFHTGTVGQVVHIVLFYGGHVQVPFQCLSDEFGGVTDGGALSIVLILQHVFGLRHVFQELPDQILLGGCRWEILFALIRFFHAFTGTDVAHIVLQVFGRSVTDVAAG